MRGDHGSVRSNRISQQPFDKYQQEEPKPMPLGDKCNYLCPYFRCNKRALSIQIKYVKGTPQKIGFCRWVGDTCIAGECQYAYCEKRALLPGNKCAFAINKKETVEEIEQELEREDDIENKIKDVVARKLGKKGYDAI